MSDKVKFNLKNAHYALETVTTTGAYSYATPVAIPGAVSLSLSPRGEAYTFYADGMEYFRDVANNGYEGDLEAALIPEAFRKDILGDIEDTNHNLIESADAETKYFALGFQFDGDDTGSLYWLYHCTAARPEVASQTNKESKEVQTETLSITSSPRADGYVRIKSTDETSTAARAAWFGSVAQPAVTTG